MSQETVEINGVKFEINMDTAKRIDTFKVGDNVRLLDKRYSSSQIYTGVILGFYNFKELPTMTSSEELICRIFNIRRYSFSVLSDITSIWSK